MKKADIGLIGLGVMGENLAINIESKGYAVSVFNRTTARVKDFTEGRAAGKRITGAWTLKELAESLERPRKIMIMVRAGEPVDETIEHLLPLLEKGDILIDGGNSHFADTARRMACLGEKGLLYVGTGVSGGEEGALAIRNVVALFRNGQAGHLERGGAEGGREAVPVLGAPLHGKAVYHAADDGLLYAAVRAERGEHGKIVVGAVGGVEYLRIKALGHEDAGIHVAPVQQLLIERRHKGAEDIARAKVKPGRARFGIGGDGRAVKRGQPIALGD